MEHVRVGEVLKMDRIAVTPLPTKEYVTIGIRSFGKGIFHYEPKVGSQLGALRFFEVAPDRLVISNIKGWEGAIAVSSNLDAGCIASNRFLTYAPVDERIDVRWAQWYFLSEMGIELVQRASPGSADRNRTLAIDRFEALEIPLPPVEKQRNQVRRLDSVGAAARRARMRIERPSMDHLLPAIVDALTNAVATGQGAVETLADFVSDIVHPGEDPGAATSFVGLQHVESHTGRRLGADSLEGIKGRKFRFRPGDVVYGYLRPYLNKAWLADRAGLCSVDQYVLRPRPGVDAGLLAHLLRSRQVLSQAIDLTHSLQLPRLRSALLARIALPLVSAEDVPVLVHQLDAARDQVRRATELRSCQLDLVAALVPSALNEAFAGLN